MTGPVYLVGAGPGDPGLITRRGLELLRSCDVVLYDRLVPEALLDEAPADAERVFVGKEPGQRHSRQIVADALLVTRAREGKTVVRLKGGDPFVFGRGGEELHNLVAAGIPFEVVPGVTSAIAVPAYAGIPVTHRGLSSSVAFMTGYEAPEEEGGPARVSKWEARADTLVLLMSVSALSSAVDRLVDAGRDPHEPAAIVEWGTTPRQRTLVADLGSIAESARAASVGSPAIVVIGRVVQLREALNWFESRPLFGHRVVVTRPQGRADELTTSLSALGADVVAFPTIEIVDPPSWDAVDAAIADLEAGGYAWVGFSSANGVVKFFGRMEALGKDARIFAGAKVAAVGSVTAEALSHRGIKPDLVPERFSATDVATALGPGRGERILLPRPSNAPRRVVDEMTELGWSPDEVEPYTTVSATPDDALVSTLRSGAFDIVTFASPSAVTQFSEIVGTPPDLGLDRADGGKVVACIGPVTAQAAEEVGFKVDIVPAEHTARGLLAAILERFATPTEK